MSSVLSIKRATEAELPVVLELVRGLARYEKLEHQFCATEDDYRRALFGDSPRAEIWLARSEESAVGFVTLFHTFSTFLGKPGLFLEDLYVVESARGRGYGTELFQFVVGLARERGCARLEWTALDWNEPAIRFYLGKGAQQLEDWRLFRLLPGEELRKP